jgi:outer membrane protein assembly factor BamB
MRLQLSLRRLCGAALAAAFAVSAAASHSAFADDWPQWRGPARDGVWREKGILTAFPADTIPVKWRVPVGSGYSGPTVANGRVYLTDRIEEPTELERVHCFDAETGTAIWTHSYPSEYGGIGYPAGPRASVTVHDGRAYSLGARGHFNCFDADNGSIQWTKDLDLEYNIRLPTWGIAAAPLVEGDHVIVHIGGADNACLVAFDRRTGQERWRALPDAPSYVAPIVIDQAGRRVLVGWTAERVVGLDPEAGTLLWEFAFPAHETVIAIATPVFHNDHLFFTSFYDGSLMLRVHQDRLGVEKVWQARGQNEQNTLALHSIISTPILLGEHVYGVDSYGELRCLDGRTGERVWESDQAVPRNRWATIHFIRHRPEGAGADAERIWMFNEKGDLIISQLSPEGFTEISRAHLIKPTLAQLGDRRRGGVCWSHPAFAGGHVFARNDEELVCADLRAAP